MTYSEKEGRRTVLTCPELNPEPSSVQHDLLVNLLMPHRNIKTFANVKTLITAKSEQSLAFWNHNPADFDKIATSENWFDYPENYPQITLKTEGPMWEVKK